MNKDESLEKIEKQLDLLSLKVNIIYRKLAHGERMLNKKPNHRSKDELFEQAKSVVVKAGEASASLLQKKLLIGYASAAELLELLEADSIIGPSQGSMPRKVLIKK